jgi:cardiolipin synthase
MTQKNGKEKILIDKSFFHALLQDIKNSKKNIFLETYIFENDPLGKKILKALCDAAKRGVNTKLLIDGFGSKNWPSDLSNQLIASGGFIRIYHPLPWKFYHWKYSSYFRTSLFKGFIYFFKVINARNHRKTCIIDKKIAYIGSANISAHPKLGNSIKWHDFTLRLEGETTALEEAFHYAWEGKIPKTRYPFDNQSSIYRINNNFKKRKFLFKDLLSKADHAKKRIWIMNSFFISHFSFVKTLKKAANRGIDVTILVPGYSDVALIPLLTRYYYNYFLKYNVKLMEYQSNAVLHCKVIIIDDWFCIGSSNFNNRSLRHDLEIDVSLQTSSAKRALESEINNHFERAKPITVQILGRQSIFVKLIGRLLILIRYWC